MRTRARVDDNQPAMVDMLRRAGALVTSTSVIGNGFPDLIVAFRGRIFLLEVKDGTKPKSRQKLTKQEAFFHLVWKDYVQVVNSEWEALRAIGAL